MTNLPIGMLPTKSDRYLYRAVALLRYKRICLHFSTASLFSVYHPHVGTAAFIHILLVRSLLKVLSLL
jgi:hypothetical protein